MTDQATGVHTATEEIVAAALPRYGLAGAEVELLNVSENTTYLVRPSDGGGPTVLRVHRPAYNTPEEIGFELAWMDALRDDAGVLTPRVIESVDGKRVITIAPGDSSASRSCAMFELCPGNEPSEAELAETFQRLGGIAAVMHRHARAWRRPRGFSRRRWDLDTTIGVRAEWGSWAAGPNVGSAERVLLQRLSRAVFARVAEYGEEPERFGLIHADIRPGNILLHGDDTYVIDFDDCGAGWFMFDLATAFTFMEGRSDIGELVQVWRDGYATGGQLAEADVAIVPALMMLRRVEVLAWLGSHAETDLARSEGAEYTATTCALADRYLTDGLTGWVD